MAWARRALAGVTILASTSAVGGVLLTSTPRFVPVETTVAVAAVSPDAPAATVATEPAPTTVAAAAPAPSTTVAPEKVELAATNASAPAPAPTPAAPAPSSPAPSPSPQASTAGAPAIAPAPAPAPPPAPAPTSPAEIGAAALQLIDYPWQKLGYEVNFEGPNPGLLGKANCRTNQIWVYVRPTQTIRQVAFVTAFELGHAVDCGTMNSARRAEWAAIRGFAPGWTWFPSCLCTEDNFGSGDISMVFATWLIPDGGYRWRSNLAPPPSAAQLQRLLPYLRPGAVG